MASHRLTPQMQEWAARLLLLALAIALVAGIMSGLPPHDVHIVQASMPENGGWQPGNLSAAVGQPLHLHLTSNDVVHTFAVGRTDMAAVDVEPGKVTELTLTFDEPGTYTFYCTRWCGPNHWRMRGTIVVSGEGNSSTVSTGEPPLFVQLGLNIDLPHPATVTPSAMPSAERGAALGVALPQELSGRETYMTQSPVEVWLTLRDLPELSSQDDTDSAKALSESALWDVVAHLWRQNTTPETVALGAALYSQNCAACHGENGAGDGVFASSEQIASASERDHGRQLPTDFTDPALLAASNALLQGKIIRGGMGTGMPAWGSILSDGEIQALLDYLWTFQFAEDGS